MRLGAEPCTMAFPLWPTANRARQMAIAANMNIEPVEMDGYPDPIVINPAPKTTVAIPNLVICAT